MTEYDPNGVSPHTPGAKLDAGKTPVTQGTFHYFPRALLAVAEVSAHGASKYTWMGWAEVPDGVARYRNAHGRHVLKEAIDGPYDPDSRLLHQAHKAWNELAVLELMLKEGTPLQAPESSEG